MGNFLNHGHARGGAAGFDVPGTLGLLPAMLDNAKARSLLHYVLAAARRAAPHALRVGLELEAVRAGARVRLEGLGAEVRALGAGLDEARVLCAALDGPGPGPGGGPDEFARKLRGVVAGWEELVQEAKAALAGARAGFRQTLLFLGRRPAEVEAETDRCEDGEQEGKGGWGDGGWGGADDARRESSVVR